MGKLKLLLKIQILGTFGLNKALHTDRAKAKRSIALFALAAIAVGAAVTSVLFRALAEKNKKLL